ncbi:MAG: hypothetical protein KF744_17560 [Taibaiella sp.]|nr:hypothetical protein [Taibaiella sp.]
MTVTHTISIPGEWIISQDRFNNQSYVESRCASADKSLQGNLRSALKYLYLDEEHGGISTFSKTAKNAVLENKLLEPAEVIIFKYLFTRTNGSEKYHYGKPALVAAKAARYRCQRCNSPDVRSVCLDHVWSNDLLTGFKMLCYNCHAIKSREDDWQGSKKLRNKKEALALLISLLQ